MLGLAVCLLIISQCSILRIPDEVEVVPIDHRWFFLRPVWLSALDKLLGSGKGALLLAVNLNTRLNDESSTENYEMNSRASLYAVFRNNNGESFSAGNVFFDSLKLVEQKTLAGDVIYSFPRVDSTASVKSFNEMVRPARSYTWRIYSNGSVQDSFLVEAPASNPVIVRPTNHVRVSSDDNLSIEWRGSTNSKVIVQVGPKEGIENFADLAAIYAYEREQDDIGRTVIPSSIIARFRPGASIIITVIKFTDQKRTLSGYGIPIRCVLILAERIEVKLI